MQKNNLFNFFRFAFAITGILCLFLALSQLSYYILNTKDQEPDTPTVEIRQNVLYLSSFDSMHANYDEKKNGIESVFYDNGIQFDIAFMDVKSFSGDSNVSSFYNFFSERYNNNSADYTGIIVSDDNALQFAMDHQKEFFDGLPIVFFAINNRERAATAEANPYITGVFEPDYIGDTIKYTVATMPHRKTFVALHDESEAGLVDIDEFLAYTQDLPDYDIIEINTARLTMSEIIEELKKLPDDSVVFYMACYNDATGHKYSLLDLTNTIKEYTDAPIMRNYVGGREMGILGGTYMNAFDQAKQAAIILNDILNNNKKITDYDLMTDAASITCFNYSLMKKYGISEKLLPEDTVYINKPMSLYETYKDILPIAVFIMLSLLSLVGSISFAFINEKNHVKDLERSKTEIENSKFLLQYQAEHDELLDLLNRRSIVNYLQENVKSNNKYTIILLDIDGFKDVNENYGHVTGDLILNDIADRLKYFADSHDLIIGRYGGDEFIMLKCGSWLDKDSEIVKDLMDLFGKPFVAGEVNILLSISVGISHSDNSSDSQEHIINSEIALYEAKANGKNIVCVYADEMKQKLSEESNIKNAFLNAFDHDGFYMKYQPKVSAKTRELIGFEALVRLKDAPFGPSQFIPIAEKNGWTSKLGRIITEIVIKQIAKWKSEGRTIYPVSINYSSRQLNDTGYVEFLESLLEKYGIEPKYIEIEITESLLVEKTDVSEKLFADLKRLGISLLLDDFGTGYSSLAYLTYVPVENVKLDKSLVDSYLVDGKDAFIKDVIQLVHDIGKLITIEGVEEEWQFERLREFNADMIQGYFFSEPLDPDEAINYSAD
ncbi:diguanylate cyclase (GGDEF) domain-containing protein [Lachnospiraceae bacterium JC7]|nr:diguanylate cyclase (GGDEF) domain-containing protein [Lachnospiraceae bacterium JC7]